jgi:hypothetical protein
MNNYADLEIRILGLQSEGYPVELTLNYEQEFPGGYLDPDWLPFVFFAIFQGKGKQHDHNKNTK